MKSAALVGLFCWCLYPLGVGELSVNYTFALIPLAMILGTGRLAKPPFAIALAMLVFSLIFVGATIFYVDMYGEVLHRLGSFVVFMSLFAYAVVRVRPSMIAAFKTAVVVMSVAFSLYAIVVFLNAAAAGPVNFEAKDLVGSQRYGFVYVIAFWLILLAPRPSGKWRLFDYLLLAIVVSGLLLTFSRSSIVSLAGSLLIFAVARGARGLYRPNVRHWMRFAVAGAAVVGIAVLAARTFPLTVEYYAERLLTPLLDGRLVDAMAVSTSSEGSRVVRVTEGLDYVLRNPLTGTGFLGVWSFSPSGAGSAHNQLLDVFIRVGLVGFVVYLYLLLQVVRYLAKHDASLFWGMVGVLIYGMFHETFKESQGAFILSFLVGMYAQHRREQYAYRSLKRGSTNGADPARSPAPA